MPINYKDAGVDVANGQKEVELIKKLVEKTQSENVLSKSKQSSCNLNIEFDGW